MRLADGLPVGMPPGWRLQGTLAQSRGLGRFFFKFRLYSVCLSEEHWGGVHRVHSLGCRVAALPPTGCVCVDS